MKIHLGTNERAVFVGVTGSGKTVLAKRLLSRLNRVVAIDPKNTLRIDGFQMRHNLPLIGKRFQIIYRTPRLPHSDDDYRLGDFLASLMKTKNVTIYCDELSSLRDKFPYSTNILADLVRTGRELNVAVWVALQRPRWVPLWFFTEADAIFLFNLRSLKDRLYMSEFVGEAAQGEIEDHAFWWSHVRERVPALMRVNLLKNYIEKIG